MFGITLEPFNYAAVFGCMLGVYLIVNIDVIAREGVTFIKGWRT